MKRFTAKIVDLMKGEKLYASQGGPIILSQVNFASILFSSFFIFFKEFQPMASAHDDSYFTPF